MMHRFQFLRITALSIVFGSLSVPGTTVEDAINRFTRSLGLQLHSHRDFKDELGRVITEVEMGFGAVTYKELVYIPEKNDFRKFHDFTSRTVTQIPLRVLEASI